ncbi:Patched domain-containing protein 3 [Toxocara canis]|uniref:Patched domain-containing protein 3 n=1 Tax=Toxocara canis TaxID=6265 RepID=A0A0B2VCX3_TOXCA|nr:Patched domain-containing protein 3 [Toxocara canis]
MTCSLPTRILNAFFGRVGCAVVDYPFIVFSVVLTITAIFSAKYALTNIKDDITSGYAPQFAQGIEEIEVYKRFNGGRDPILTYLLVMAKDGGTMSRLTHLNATVDIMHQIANEFPVKNITYGQICGNFCMFNEPVLQFRNALMSIGDSLSNAENLVGNLSYPISQILGFRYDLTPNFFGVTTYDESEITNSTASNIKDLRMILLQFRARTPDQWNKDDVTEWDRAVSNFYLNVYNNSFVRPLIFSWIFAEDEMIRTGSAMEPYLFLGFIIITIFSVVTTYFRTKTVGQVLQDVGPSITITSLTNVIAFGMGIFSRLPEIHLLSLACSTAVALTYIYTITLYMTLVSLGVQREMRKEHTTDIKVNNVPSSDSKMNTIREQYIESNYTVVTIFVNNPGDLSNALRVKKIKDMVNEFESLDECNGVLQDVGPSITITSLTNVIAFGMGIFSRLPEIHLLSLACSTAVALTYIYTITLYMTLVSLGVQREMRKEHTTDIKVNNVPSSDSKSTGFLTMYCDWLWNPFTSIFLLPLLTVYWYVSITGTLSAQPALSTDKMFLKGSSVLEMNTIREQYIESNYTVVTIFVNNPGDLSNALRVKKIKDMVNEFESLDECNGGEFTNFWIRSYEIFLRFDEEEEEEDDDNKQDLNTRTAFTSQNIREFVKWPEYAHWDAFMRFDEQTNALSSFFITVAYHGIDLSEPAGRLKLLKRWRAIAKKYSELSVTIYEDEAIDLDLLETLVPSGLQTSIATIFCMALICIIFMQDVATVIIAVGSITSICLGVFGLLTLWHIDLDPFSIAALTISIGISVDSPAHITYHYYRSGYENKRLSIHSRLRQSLTAVGFPLLQCSWSNILLVLCLCFIPCYMSEVFIKTVLLVSLLSAIHALIVIPALLCACTNFYNYFWPCR